ncbi:hypothetical protein HLI01_31820 [Rhizobium laguerreae]|uniref:hypothetical protein n=1 Tax=Rhizobium laguerreae TaxID=1076926 RepID=UPI0014789684|nr:hypothetical protein [Rhizobium laguerreae]NNH61307.1 hypothetical protein [Rhizobium laguerreae]
MRLGDTQLALQYQRAEETVRRVGEIGANGWRKGPSLPQIRDLHSDDPATLDYAGGAALKRLRSIAEPAAGKTDVVAETMALLEPGTALGERRRPRLH